MVKPELTGTLAISKGCHPILALTKSASAAQGTVVPNDVYACDDTNFIIITGPNMVKEMERVGGSRGLSFVFLARRRLLDIVSCPRAASLCTCAK